MKALFVGEEIFAVFQIYPDGSKTTMISGNISELDLLKDPDNKWFLPDVVEDYSGTFSLRRPEPGEHVVDLAKRMMEEIGLDYSIYHNQSPLMKCIHGEAF